MKLKILGIEQATGQSGNTYWRIQTNQGDMTAFSDTIVEALKEAWIDKTEINLNVIRKEKDGKVYMNIKGFADDDETVSKSFPNGFPKRDIDAEIKQREETAYDPFPPFPDKREVERDSVDKDRYNRDSKEFEEKTKAGVFVKPRVLGKTASEREAIQNAMLRQKAYDDRKSVKGSAYEKDPVGLAVEVFNALLPTKVETNHKGLMELAIELVEQAQKGFR